MIRLIVIILFLFVIVTTMAVTLVAQEDGATDDEGIYGYTSLEVTGSTTLVGYVETKLDASIGSYYSARAIANLLDANGKGVAYTNVSEPDPDIDQAVINYTTANPGETYTLVGSRAGVLEISDPCESCRNDYVDYYDYSAYTGDDIDAIGEYEFMPHGNPVPAHEVVTLGTTRVEVQATVPTACGDVRDQIRQEYVTYNIAYSPTCSIFTQTASAPDFSFAELNTGTYTWAILQRYFLTGIETVRSGNGGVALSVVSAYRNPAKQVKINPSVPNGRHVYGDAVDFGSNGNTWQGLHNAGKAASGCVEPIAAQSEE
jgi:hypothetical protein